MVSKGGLVFIGGGDGYLYALEKRNGREVWRGKIPYENTANPMTYRTRSGKQHCRPSQEQPEHIAHVMTSIGDQSERMSENSPTVAVSLRKSASSTSMSSSVVRWFMMHARKAKRPSTAALLI